MNKKYLIIKKKLIIYILFKKSIMRDNSLVCDQVWEKETDTQNQKRVGYGYPK